jgi:hypothetical protein
MGDKQGHTLTISASPTTGLILERNTYTFIVSLPEEVLVTQE